MMYFGRAVVISELDPVPSGLRIGPRVVVMNRREVRAIGAVDAVVRAQLLAAIRRYETQRLRQQLEQAAR